MNKKYTPIAAAVLLLCGCISQPKNSTEQEPEQGQEQQDNPPSREFSYKTLFVEERADSIGDVSYTLQVDYPTQGPQLLMSTAQQAIFRVLEDSLATEQSTSGRLDTLAHQTISNWNKEIRQLKEQFGDDVSSSTYSFTGEIKVMENKDAYITYKVKSYTYTGGAHGTQTDYCFTIARDNDQLLAWDDIIPQKHRKELEEIVKRALQEQYYGGTHEWQGIFEFTLPQYVPALTSKGLMFNYADYEIDCHAAGLPYCTVPYSEVKHLLTTRVQGLIK